MMVKTVAQFFIAFLALGTAQANECDVTVAEQATATAVIDGGSFALNDGRRVQLAGIQAPRAGWPLAEEARANLAKLLEGKAVDLAYADRGTDRHGDMLAYSFVGEELVQSRLIEDPRWTRAVGIIPATPLSDSLLRPCLGKARLGAPGLGG